MSNSCFESQTNTILSSLIEVVRDIQYRFGKFEKVAENIESRVQCLANKIEAVESKLDTVVNQTSEIEENVCNMGNVVHKIIDKCRENITKIENLDSLEHSMMKHQEYTEKKLKTHDDDILELKWRSMNTNLIITGIDYSKDEDTEEKLNAFMKEKLNIDNSFDYVSVHRFGKKNRRGTRPILAKFLRMKDKETVMKNSFKLKGKNLRIQEQFPKEIEQRRKLLYPVAKKARKEKKKVLLVRDRLFIDGNLFESDETSLGNKYNCDIDTSYSSDIYRPTSRENFQDTRSLERGENTVHYPNHNKK